MFDSNAEGPETSILLWMGHLIAAPVCCMILGLIVGGELESIFAVDADDRIAGLLIGYSVYAIVGFALGRVIQKAYPTAYQSGGRWAWALPTGILAWAILDQLSRAPYLVITDYFLPPPGNEGPGMVLITWPMIATCFYTVGLRGNRGETGDSNQLH